jgi:putative ABC transport system ATP-binding protein
MEIVATLKGQGKTIIMASHDPIVYGEGLVDRIVGVRDGCLVTDGTLP